MFCSRSRSFFVCISAGAGDFFMNTLFELFLSLFGFPNYTGFQFAYSIVLFCFIVFLVAAPLYFIYRIFRRLL